MFDYVLNTPLKRLKLSRWGWPNHQDCYNAQCFLFLLISKCYLEIYFFWTCICTVSKWEECDFGLNKIASRLQENRRWQPMVLVEEELYYLSISAVIFSLDIVLLYNYRKDVWYFHQKNCRRSKMCCFFHANVDRALDFCDRSIFNFKEQFSAPTHLGMFCKNKLSQLQLKKLEELVKISMEQLKFPKSCS